MRRMPVRFAWLQLLLIIACGGQNAFDQAAMKTEISAMLLESQKAWNEGDIEKYMESYSKSDSVRFAGNGDVVFGWQTVLDRYKRGYPDKTAMGKLTFSEVDITVISNDAALVFGRWRLERELDEPSGIYTLLVRKTEGGWRIVHDHSSKQQD